MRAQGLPERSLRSPITNFLFLDQAESVHIIYGTDHFSTGAFAYIRAVLRHVSDVSGQLPGARRPGLEYDGRAPGPGPLCIFTSPLRPGPALVSAVPDIHRSSAAG